MKKVILVIALTLWASADVSCIRVDDTLTICTDTNTGESTNIWTY